MTDVPHRITPSFASHIQFCRTEEFSLNPSFSCYLPLSPLFLRSEIRRAFHIIVSLAPFSLPFRHHWRSKMQPKSFSAKTTLPASVMLLPWLSAWHTSSWSDALETRNSAHQMILKFANLQMIMAAAGVDWIWSSDFVGITWIDVVSEGVHCWRWVLAKLCVWLESVSFCKNLTLLGTGRWKEDFWGLESLTRQWYSQSLTIRRVSWGWIRSWARLWCGPRWPAPRSRLGPSGSPRGHEWSKHAWASKRCAFYSNSYRGRYSSNSEVQIRYDLTQKASKLEYRFLNKFFAYVIQRSWINLTKQNTHIKNKMRHLWAYRKDNPNHFLTSRRTCPS